MVWLVGYYFMTKINCWIINICTFQVFLLVFKTGSDRKRAAIEGTSNDDKERENEVGEAGVCQTELKSPEVKVKPELSEAEQVIEIAFLKVTFIF
jgi:hypothetical protein